jgi:hypothetical protein
MGIKQHWHASIPHKKAMSKSGSVSIRDCWAKRVFKGVLNNFCSKHYTIAKGKTILMFHYDYSCNIFCLSTHVLFLQNFACEHRMFECTRRILFHFLHFKKCYKAFSIIGATCESNHQLWHFGHKKLYYLNTNLR